MGKQGKADLIGSKFETVVKQGCTISPTVINTTFDWMMWKSTEGTLKDLDFAGGLVLLSESHQIIYYHF
jgi:hypothetical protein